SADVSSAPGKAACCCLASEDRCWAAGQLGARSSEVGEIKRGCHGAEADCDAGQSLGPLHERSRAHAA
ncbi:unnamed protein product, partial [Effrenium voratum]